MPVVPSDQGLVNVYTRGPHWLLFKTLQRHGTAGRIADQALQLVPPMGWHLGVGVQRKPVDTGTAGACEWGRSPS